MIPIDLYENRFVDSEPTLVTTQTTSITRTIAFELAVPTQLVQLGPATIARYELFDGETSENLPAFSPTGFVQAETLDIFDETTGVTFNFTPQGVTATIAGVDTPFQVEPAGALDDLFRQTVLPITVVPEPSCALLVLMGILGLSQLRQRARLICGSRWSRDGSNRAGETPALH